MEGRSPLDFKKFTSPSGSKMYMFKILFYVIVIGGLLYLLKVQASNKKETKSNSQNEITNVSVDTTLSK